MLSFYTQITCLDNSDEQGCSAGIMDCNFNRGIDTCQWQQQNDDDLDWTVAKSASMLSTYTIAKGMYSHAVMCVFTRTNVCIHTH